MLFQRKNMQNWVCRISACMLMKLREVAILLSVVFTAFPEKSDCYQRSYELTYTVVRMRVTLTLCSAFVLLRVAGSRTGFKINQPHAEMNSKCLIGRPSYSIFIRQTDDANCRNCAFLDRILSSATPRAPSTDSLGLLHHQSAKTNRHEFNSSGKKNGGW